MNKIMKFCLAIVLLSLTAYILDQYTSVELGNSNFWDHHGLFFLFFISVFPRITLILSTTITGGLIWWLGWIFAPRILVACLATLTYWQQNPILVAISWLVAVGGESSEKMVIVRRTRFGRTFGPRSRERQINRADIIDVEPIRRE